MPDIPDKSIDMILCDLPYGCLNRSNKNASWDSVVDLDKLWENYTRIIKDNGAIVLFGQGLFSCDLMTHGRKYWRYNLVWKKGRKVSGFLNANRQPLRNHEDILVFSKKQTKYNPQMVTGLGAHIRGGAGNGTNKDGSCSAMNNDYGGFKKTETVITDERYPSSIVDFSVSNKDVKFHQTCKPVALLEWLIRTYTDAGEIVLDNTMGSGSTGVACVNTGRNFIGIEITDKYYQTALDRICKEV